MLVKSATSEGFILNGFPRTSKQALLFVKEIANVDAVIYLYSNTNDMISRVQQKHGQNLNVDHIKKDIMTYMKEARDSTSKFSAKLERVRIQIGAICTRCHKAHFDNDNADSYDYISCNYSFLRLQFPAITVSY